MGDQYCCWAIPVLPSVPAWSGSPQLAKGLTAPYECPDAYPALAQRLVLIVIERFFPIHFLPVYFV